ncbi:hypothetical protein F5J12DRAFT_346810 [Pisolithus orientalis]|uniref:uncharacterized protein n=1 Tax=Pisolithus orientalis TaxID=936130 RepID=UPI002224A0F3|nr:uncharacterized protein F5J12DRAFT_346810 [Pisolithus orientalis]KAI5996854.1 hypothetical protein F5J12DRAFT_346810 [Pisolithus orientalis]
MSSSEPSIPQAEVAGLVMPAAAMVITSFRLFVRWRQGRLWLDDAWAALAMVFNVGFLVVVWLYLHDYARYPQDTRVALYYMVAQFFYAVIWITILFTVVRLTFPGSLRRMLVRTAFVFLIAWMVLAAQIFWTCAVQSGWKTESRPQCSIGRNVAIAQIISDVLSDTILIIAPFRLIYRVRLTKAQKIRLLSVFSTSAITTIVSLVHAYYVLANAGLKVIVAAIFEESVSLIVANLSVVVAFLFRISTEESTTPASLELKSIITFGSQPTRKGTQNNPLSTPSMVVAIETQTIQMGDFSMSAKHEAGRDGNDTEAASFETLSKPGLFHDA